ncbi:MAG: copper resistance protein B [Thiobacillus sp.]|nr:copper resistance protein B [Thiobacillus sp.]
MKNKRMNVLAMAIAAMAAAPVWAQTAGDAGMMDHSMHGSMPAAEVKPKAVKDAKPAMDHSTMDHGAMPGMTPKTAETAGTIPGMDHGKQPASQPAMESMDHGEMKMQGGPAPTDARDPHVYSGGFARGAGTYALPESQRLRLADEHNFGGVLVDRLEWNHTRDGNSTAYDTQAWFGRDYNRLVVKAEGEVAHGKLEEARTELLWGHAIATFWDTQLGVRYDSGEGPDRGWLAFGVQGLAPYWFEVDAAAYVGDNGRTALRLGAEYELLLTQKLVLQPRIEVNAYGKSDIERGIGSGLSQAQTGLRLRYEFTRQFAPYIGVERASKFGKTASLARADGEKAGETRWVAGVRFWY